MYISDLSREQLIELKQSYLFQLDDSGELKEVIGIDAVSWSTLLFADEIVPDEIIVEHYAGICFSEDDFFCSYNS